MFSHEIQITDSMVSNAYGHVHHADSIKFIEAGRNAYLVSRGMPYESLHAEDVYIVVTRVEADYLREVKPGLHFSKVLGFTVEGARITAMQELLKENGKVCIRAKVEMACMSGKTRRAIPLPEKLRVLLLSQA